MPAFAVARARPINLSLLRKNAPRQLTLCRALPRPRTPPPRRESTTPTAWEPTNAARDSLDDFLPGASITDTFDVGGLSSSDYEVKAYNLETVQDIIKERTPWLFAFGIGLIAAAFVVEHFEGLIEEHVQLSFFVPLIMGHGGNTGSQAVSSIIRALALRQVRWRKGLPVVIKEATAGGAMGGMIGLGILALSLVWKGLNTETGIAVAIALPLVSFWSNGLAAGVTLASSKLRLDPAMTSGPLVTTLVDSTGLIIYFLVAEAVIKANIV